jgi:ABC-type transport system involved in multi-copper enzyme maturation permease subunit
MRRIGVIALNTFREAIRNKILYALVFFAVALILASVAVARLSLHEEQRVVEDLGLGATSLFGVLIAVFIGVNLVYKELEKKTVYILIPKPIYRWQFLVGKYVGTGLTMGVLIGFMALVFFAVLLLMGTGPRIVLIKALWLYFVEVMVISAVALFFSSFSSPFLSGLFTLLVFVVGRLTAELRDILTRVDDVVLTVLAKAALVVSPDLHVFNVSGAAVGGKWISVHGDFVTFGYVAQATLYGVLYSTIVLLLAVALFRRRDFV